MTESEPSKLSDVKEETEALLDTNAEEQENLSESLERGDKVPTLENESAETVENTATKVESIARSEEKTTTDSTKRKEDPEVVPEDLIEHVSDLSIESKKDDKLEKLKESSGDSDLKTPIASDLTKDHEDKALSEASKSVNASSENAKAELATEPLILSSTQESDKETKLSSSEDKDVQDRTETVISRTITTQEKENEPDNVESAIKQEDHSALTESDKQDIEANSVSATDSLDIDSLKEPVGEALKEPTSVDGVAKVKLSSEDSSLRESEDKAYEKSTATTLDQRVEDDKAEVMVDTSKDIETTSLVQKEEEDTKSTADADVESDKSKSQDTEDKSPKQVEATASIAEREPAAVVSSPDDGVEAVAKELTSDDPSEPLNPVDSESSISKVTESKVISTETSAKPTIPSTEVAKKVSVTKGPVTTIAPAASNEATAKAPSATTTSTTSTNTSSKPVFDPDTVYLYTSLTAGGYHIMPDTMRLGTILKANDIEYQMIDIATNERAKRIWKYRGIAKGKKLPAVVRDDEVMGDIKEIEDANEFGEVRDLVFDEY
ncbi:hypothetical protein AWJ20_2709 [Sugiyamaella lignohabitans]|uniref:Uncharacterized protein n=1 Tax=Sugiyamaella lignohabitans TaxID=796027 RepID=A0A167FBW9_9ASCO|nr:uncharacterized protein AWJ20_2709 [Sugiyamaella lignohabitans]ANB15089.1 hypothetical protein AWJ20_2709 [Sugiyamaella lignohabitans]